MSPGVPRRRHARPVADAPIGGLLPRTEELAKGWLLALLEQATLARAPGILGAGLVVEGPALCEAVLRALTGDAALRQLEPGGAAGGLAARVGDLGGADPGAPAEVAGVVDALHGVMWAALCDELRAPAAALVSDLAQRLAVVCEALRAAALGREPSLPSTSSDAAPALAPAAASGDAPAPTPAPAAASTDAPARTGPEPNQAPETRPAAADEDEGGSEPLWVGALEDEISRSQGSPLSLLLAELEDAERIAATESAAAAAAAIENFVQAIRGVMRHQDILVRESDTRAWIIARETARAGAQSLGTRMAEAVGARSRWRGGPLIATVGVAVLGEDGQTSAELREAAEEARFAAAASGTEVVP